MHRDDKDGRAGAAARSLWEDRREKGSGRRTTTASLSVEEEVASLRNDAEIATIRRRRR